MATTLTEFYKDKTIFITGATGFIGKVLLEKLLRCCSSLKCIYCLVRDKNGETAAERLEKLLGHQCFDNLWKEASSAVNVRDKVKVIRGDMLLDGLGVDSDQRFLLDNSVDVVFHAAATVKFDEPLKYAIEMNVLGARRLIQICSTMKHLQSVVHISTAFANCDQPFISEQVYPAIVEPDKVLELLDWLDDEAFKMITTKMIGEKPNSFTYTKHLAEVLLLKEGSHLPISIIRPSIVTAAWREPVPGWIDSENGPSSLYIAMGKGLLRSMIADHHVNADIVPVDLPVNMMVVVAWYRTLHKQTTNATSVYHITSGGLNPFTWGEMENSVTNYFKKNPLDSCFRRPKSNVITSNSFMHDCWILVSHLIPAYAADLGYLLTGQKTRMVETYNRLHRTMEVLEYFTTRSWEWTHAHLDVLKNNLTQEELKTFSFDPRVLHWPTYIENFCLGTKKFLLKEDPAGLPAARARIKMLRNIRYAFNTVLLVLAWRVLIANSSLARNSWFFVLGLVFKFVRFFRLTSTLS
ncbi:hypothetical protein HELRODRAFT_70906 [Helobdella robusta]|uniref:Fatty acyl-CoA reductase n=1 Tax=Helobdella robusta TaxID=6412 RepID=T1G0E1_HELRO|nr:hypothetical protein HELRODRAFT_70906 [Helobdella robusta]ESN90598.1 hypothetical protein HELRODRAFT_70906 [Helobdella robusta]